MNGPSSRWSPLAEALRSGGLRAETDCDFGAVTTYRVGGRAALGVWVGSVEEAETLGQVLAAAAENHRPEILPVGNGSNLLVADDGFDGIAVFLGDGLAGAASEVPVRRSEDVTVTLSVGAGMSLPTFARRCVAAGWCGAEWMVGVPGTIGGAVRMNAGGHGSDMAAMLVRAEIVSLATGRRAAVPSSDLALRFRGSALSDHHLVVGVELDLVAPHDHDGRDCEEELAAIVAWRRERQPGGHNAGSVFVNPGSGRDSAGALVEAAGMRGHRHGTAAVSDKHANFIQSDPGGRAADIVAVMCEVQDAVGSRTGRLLRSEVRLVGFPAEIVARFSVHSDYGVDDGEIAAAAARLESLV